jgi:type II secretory pathway pseudopilin PulG
MRSVRGFSTIELIIVIAISVILMLAVVEIYVTYSNSYLYQNAAINTSSSAAAFLNEFNDMSLQADAIVASRSVSGTTYTTGSTTVVFEIPAINSSGDIISNSFDYAILYASSTGAYRLLDVNGSSARVAGTKKFSDFVNNLTFTYDNASPTAASSVTADITTKSIVKQETFTSHLKQQVYLRNK